MPTHASEADRHYPLSGATPAPIETFVPQEETNMVIVGILVGLIVVLSAILVILLARPVMDFVRSRLPENQRRKELRYKTVEGWLISKKLRPHDEACDKIQAAFSSAKKADVEEGCAPTDISKTQSYDTTDTEQSFELEWSECPICMEDFTADEIISWSPDDQTSCQHFFHHECIKEWLLRSPHCPYCRETVIPIDNVTSAKVDKLTLIEMSKRRSTKTGSSFCCVEHGLVRIRRPLKLKHKMRELVDEVMACRVLESELVAKRGGRLGNDTESEDSEVSSIILEGTETTELHQSNVLSSAFNLSELEILDTGDQQDVECDLRGAVDTV